MAKKYLDYEGLLYLWGKLKAKFQNKLTAGNNITIVDDVISADGGVTDVTVGGTSVVSSGVAVVPTIPSKISDLTNDSDFVEDSSYVHTDNNYSNSDSEKVGKLAFNGTLIDESILPSYVDDVVEAYPVGTELSANWLSKTSGGTAFTPESGKIYILMADSTSYATNTQFRWGSTQYVKLNDGGVTSITNAEIDTIIAS